ncbi:MAG: hypothetical protein L3J06_02040 [Cyclobacteriaceae bacterium]|nr:hypothetical protein [Cyclobacteriaceae bacterium]
MKNSLEELKVARRKELLAILEHKKKELQKHVEESANKSIDVGKGLLAVGAGVLLLYTIFDRFLESKFRVQQNNTNTSSGKSSSNKLLYPIFSMLLQQGTSLLFDASQKKLVDYLKTKKTKNERLSASISTKK